MCAQRFSLLLVLVHVISVSLGNMYDVLSPWKIPGQKCSTGCAQWSTFANWTEGWWVNESMAAAAGSACAQLGNAPALSAPSPIIDPTQAGAIGAWCFCAPGSHGSTSSDGDFPLFDYCENPVGVPSQINIQISSPTTVVLSFVSLCRDHDLKSAAQCSG